MNKVWLFRSILLTLLAFLLFWDVMMCLGHDLPSLEHLISFWPVHCFGSHPCFFRKSAMTIGN